MYEQFARFYDELGWSQYAAGVWDRLSKYLDSIGFKPRSLLDLACGTGILTIKAAQRGVEAHGLDISEAMLEKAEYNARQADIEVSYVCGDMSHFCMNRHYDIITCTFDAINHLSAYDDWEDTFRCALAHLDDNGLFVFDMNTVKDLSENWDNIHVRKDANGNYVISKSIAFRDKASAAVTFTAFVQRSDRLFDGYEETVTEVTFPIDRVVASLYEIGFADVSVKNDMFEDVPDPEQLNRVFIICRKTKAR
ncbi:class I SAM-dependent DNA methyltransferase [Mahella australiensis]|uniref:Methyltransferase type 11 n=1 Tax=Mahella australiensis (strain DSM 15567 / CIP 107919 / 50-1 BON) TaxID=697281 RepID=F3ZXA0_MAHA5|nr:class I SAM-dependent methyltransferase [Mahella australiensis]AEE96557.1 Methyltransferase type 11 [Mahella australiensis 50-1 BON]